MKNSARNAAGKLHQTLKILSLLVLLSCLFWFENNSTSNAQNGRQKIDVPTLPHQERGTDQDDAHPRLKLEAVPNAFNSPGQQCTPQQTSVGQTVNGQLNSGECPLTLSDGVYYSDGYVFSGTAGQQISISLSSPAFDTYLALYRPDGSEISQDNNGGGGTNSRIPAGSGTIGLTVSGNHFILVTSNFPTQTGGYTLQLNGGQPTPTPTATPTPMPGGTETLKTDDGSAEGSFAGTPENGGIDVNRLTPSSYPAQLRTIQIFFGPLQGLPIPSGAQIRLLAFAGSAGTTRPPNNPPLLVNQTVTIPNTLPSGGAFVEFQINNGPTINSGDFYVGFQKPNPAGGVATFFDLNNPQQMRAFFSTDNGQTYQGPTTTGQQSVNVMIRAVVTRVQQQCNYSITPTNQFFNAAGGTGSVTVNAPAGCAWTAAANAGFITITSGASGSGNGTVVFSVGANQSQAQLSGTITIAGQIFTITQAAGAPNTVPLTSGVPQTGSISATDPGFCRLSGTQYTIQSPSGASQLAITLSGNQNVNLHVRFGQPLVIANSAIVDDYRSVSSGNNESLTITPASSPPLQTGTYYIGVNNCGSSTASFTLTATAIAPPQCSYAINPASQNFADSGGTGTVSVSTSSGCAWTSASNAPWLTISSGASGSGNGSVAYSAAANSSPSQRSGTLTVAGQTFTVTQSGQSCSFSITPAGQTFDASGGTGSVAVATANGCAWTAISNAAWLTINSGGSGSGNGTAAYSVAANNTSTQRTGTLAVAGQTFTVTQTAPVQTARTLRIVSTDGVQGGFVIVPIELVSLGDENSVAFSLNFNPAVLSNPQATLGDGVPAATALIVNDAQKTQGRFGASLQLPVNQAVSTGTRRILLVRFDIAPNPNLTTTGISFGDQPIRGVVGNVQAGELPANYAAGTVTILPGWEADVHPRPTGSNDGTVSPLDAAQVGRFAAGLDTPNNGNEFQRADCSPIATKGNGVLNGLDWAQASRYAAGLDAVATADGPRNPIDGFAELFVAELFQSNQAATPEQQRVIRVVGAQGQPGEMVNVAINIDAQGNENVFSFSLNFDPAVLNSPQVMLGNGLPSGSQLTPNQNQTLQGRLGILLLLPPGQGIGAGSRDLIVVKFNVAAGANAASTPITFGNLPIAKLVGDKDLNDLTASTTFTNGAVTIGTQNNPVPAVSSLSPNSVIAGGEGFALTINGTNFVNGATVNWNGGARQTMFASATQLTAQIPAADIATAGTASVTVVNPAPGGGASNAATFTINPPQTTARVVRMGAASGPIGGTVSVPVEFFAQGDENAVGFSLSFDPSVLGNPQVTLGSDAAGAQLNPNTGQAAQGRVGISLALNTGQTFSPGTRQIAVITFNIAAGAAGGSTPVVFSDQPILRQISDANARVLPANFTDGTVTITLGIEADVTPAPNGDGVVGMTDYTKVGRLVAGLDVVNSGSEFQRADSAPRESRGDGKLTTIDWVQAGRYAASLDPVVVAGGPTAPVSGLVEGESLSGETSGTEQAARNIRVVAGNVERGQNGSIVIAFDAQGGENAIGFTLKFDAAQLRFLSAAAGKDATGATLAVNTNQTASGRIGVVLALPGGQSFAAGARELVVLNFTATASGNPEMTTVSFGNQPVAQELADLNARVLPASFTGGSLKITRTVASVSAASFVGTDLAAEAITAAFGGNLATTVKIAEGLPLPTQLAGTTVKVKDSAGAERLAPLFFVAPAQINYLIPTGTATGDAAITITSGDGSVSNGKAAISAVAPGLFSANASGQGIAAATVLRVKANGSQVYEDVSRFDPALGKIVPVPIDLGNQNEQVFLILFGTGFRARSSLTTTMMQVGGVPAEVLYAGPQGDFVGLDQINLRLPGTLTGRGEVAINLTVDGKAANSVTIYVK